ncbi:acid protease [Saccharata proteae CBS 121410]|uniref:Acid protease n=1 Tax=Saccharata proteae CBS 121410 TaxID=1314787 RepID=A0A9P4HR28_9PEZI|nr:acid protease [Saccharata proteae CBS 121410]
MALAPRASAAAVSPYSVPTTEDWDGNDGSWSSFQISVGTPPQNFRVLISTAGHETFVPVPEGCIAGYPSDCSSSRGSEPFNSVASPGFETNQSSTWIPNGIYDLGLDTNINQTGNGQYGYDSIRLGSSQTTGAIEMDREVVAGIATLDFWMGLLGLNTISSSFSSTSQPVTSLFYNLKREDKIPSLSYAYTAGAVYRYKRVPGSLILGGYDQSRFASPDFSFTFASDDAKSLTVGVQAILVSNSLQGVASMTLEGHLSVIDSTVSQIWLPEDVCARFESAFGLTYDSTTDLYLVNDTIHAQLLQLNPSITFKLGNSIYDSGSNSTNIVLPYAAFDLQATWPYYPNATNYFPIRRAANETQYTIGRTLLQESYLVVDYERQNFTLAQTIFSDPLPDADIITIQSLNSTTPTTKAKSPSSLSTGAIVGIAVAGAAVILIAIVALLLYRRRNNRRPSELASEGHTSIHELSAPHVVQSYELEGDTRGSVVKSAAVRG